MILCLQEFSARYVEASKMYLPLITRANCSFDEKEKLLGFVTNRMNSFQKIGLKRANVVLTIVDYLMESIKKFHDGKTRVLVSMRSLYYIVKSGAVRVENFAIEDIPTVTVVTSIVNQLCCLFKCTRHSLGVMSNDCKILGFGNIILSRSSYDSSLIKEDASLCSNPKEIYYYNIVNFEPNVDHPPLFILVVEKKTILWQLLSANFHRRYPCVVITGSRQPMYECRQFIRLVEQRLKLRVFVLVDLNPNGFEIFRTMKYGSVNLSFMSRNLVTQSMEFIGLFVSDFSHCMSGMLSFNKTDKRKFKSLSSEACLGYENILEDTLEFFRLHEMKTDLEHLSISLQIADAQLPQKLTKLYFDQADLTKTSTNAAFDSFSRYNDVVLPASITMCIRESYNVTGDGHCGFRSIAHFMFGSEDKWAQVRRDLLHEIDTHIDHYTNVLGGLSNYEKQRKKLDYFEQIADEEHHLEIDALGFVVATSYQRVVVYLSSEGCLTFLPLRLTSSSSLSSIKNAEKVIILLKGNHFYALRMDDDTPLPTLQGPYFLHSFLPLLEPPTVSAES